MNDFEISYEQPREGAAVRNRLIRRVYGWMAGGLLITALVALATVSYEPLLRLIVGNRMVFYALVLGELGLVVAISGAMHRLSSATASLLFLFYAALNGATMSVIFLAYAGDSIASTFVVTSAMFGSMSLYGVLTKKDLTGWGSFLFMGLIGVVIASLVNLFIGSDTVSWIASACGVIVFTGLAAYDSWKLRMLADSGLDERKMTIMGALTLYLDFINLFLMMLRLFGRRR